MTGRQPMQVLVIPYCIDDKELLYCLFKRTDLGV